jgi:hypothetical protein
MSEEIHLKVVDEYEESEDTSRDEEKWDGRKEQFFIKIKDECLHQSNVHSVISHRNKRKYMLSAIPTTIIPLILVNIDIFAPHKEIQMIGLTLVSIINGVNTLYNFSKKCEVHNSFAGKYSDLASEIDKILIRKKKHRQAFDVMLEKITTKKRYIDDTAPYV